MAECSEKRRTKLSTNLLLNYDSLNTFHDNVNNVVSTHVVSSSSSVRREEIDQTSRQIDTQVKILTPVGKLRETIHKWKLAGASDYILSIIDKGYGIPFQQVPKKAFLNNNKSSRENVDFVETEILKLLNKGCVSEVEEIPTVVNPLTVAFNRAGKPHFGFLLETYQ